MFFYQTKPRFMAHVESHVKAMKDGVHCACPAATGSGDGIQPICDHTTPMSKDALKEHLVHNHGMIFTFEKETCKKKRGIKNAGAAEEEGEQEHEHDQVEFEHDEKEMHSLPRKKAKTSKATTKAPRQPLQGKDVNQK